MRSTFKSSLKRESWLQRWFSSLGSRTRALRFKVPLQAHCVVDSQWVVNTMRKHVFN